MGAALSGSPPEPVTRALGDDLRDPPLGHHQRLQLRRRWHQAAHEHLRGGRDEGELAGMGGLIEEAVHVVAVPVLVITVVGEDEDTIPVLPAGVGEEHRHHLGRPLVRGRVIVLAYREGLAGDAVHRQTGEGSAVLLSHHRRVADPVVAAVPGPVGEPRVLPVGVHVHPVEARFAQHTAEPPVARLGACDRGSRAERLFDVAVHLLSEAPLDLHEVSDPIAAPRRRPHRGRLDAAPFERLACPELHPAAAGTERHIGQQHIPFLSAEHEGQPGVIGHGVACDERECVALPARCQGDVVIESGNAPGLLIEPDVHADVAGDVRPRRKRDGVELPLLQV